MIIKGIGKYPKSIKIPGDKSISHRSIIFSAIGKGETKIENILISDDIIRTIDCFRKMGVKIKINKKKNEAIVKGVGLHGLKDPQTPLYCGNSGTTMRLLAGILSGQKFDSVLTGDKSLNSRPMKRVAIPLKMMGGEVRLSKDNTAPIFIKGNKKLKPIDYKMPIDSAQVKSAIILASLYAEKDSKITENNIIRNHTEIMLNYFRNKNWNVKNIFIPGDISSASYFIGGGLINPNSEILMKNIGINETRSGIIDVFLRMGGHIELLNKRSLSGEEIGDIKVKTSKLKSVQLGKNIMGRMIDEIPILAVVSSFADGETIIKGAEELRHKESDRISSICNELTKLGGDIEELEDGLIIKKGKYLNPAYLKSYGDHRIAMALSVMAYNIEGESFIEGWESVKISFPNFYNFFV